MSTATPPNPVSNRKITRRGLLRAGVRLGIGASTLTLGSTVWASEVEPDWVEVTENEVVLPRLPREFDGFRIAQISDVHIEGGDMRQHFPAICDLVTAQNADLIVMTGDYTTHGDLWQEKPLVAGFQRLKAPHGVFAVLGNHDQWPWEGDARHGATLVRSALSRGGVRELRNEAHRLEKNGASLYLGGLDDWLTRFDELDSLLAQIPSGAPAILLAHAPDLADEIAPLGRFDLLLSGHSHGGQIAAPFIGVLHVPGGAKKYPRGRYQVGDLALYTNRGLGTVGIPFRFCARPEISVFTLRAIGK
jgi:hypothetical protein